MFKSSRPEPGATGGLWSLLSGKSGLQRLLCLENAVTYYGGGWDVLAGRLQTRAGEVRTADPVTAQLLDEVAHYLQDVAHAGELGPSSWHPWRDEYPQPAEAGPVQPRLDAADTRPDHLPGDYHG